MIVYAVQLYTVDAVHLPEFLAAFRPRGLWSDIARLQPGHIHTDLLRNPADSSKFLTIDFWTSIGALLAARHSPEVRRFVLWLSRQAVDCEGLGMFVFPQQPSEESIPDGVTCASGDLDGKDKACDFRSAESELRP